MRKGVTSQLSMKAEASVIGTRVAQRWSRGIAMSLARSLWWVRSFAVGGAVVVVACSTSSTGCSSAQRNSDGPGGVVCAFPCNTCFEIVCPCADGMSVHFCSCEPPIAIPGTGTNAFTSCGSAALCQKGKEFEGACNAHGGGLGSGTPPHSGCLGLNQTGCNPLNDPPDCCTDLAHPSVSCSDDDVVGSRAPVQCCVPMGSPCAQASDCCANKSLGVKCCPDGTCRLPAIASSDGC